MSTANPTPLRVGAQGTLNGRRYTVAGRVVLGMEEDGETYYWNEFNLVDDSGGPATLVFEEGESGPEWKLFTWLEPLRAMTVEEATAIDVDDEVNLDGTPVRVTLVGESRVYHLEGRAPEGVEVGDVANYFNADAHPRMLVASWTGNAIEFYQGVDVPAARVAAAFGLPQSAPAFAAEAPTTSGFGANLGAWCAHEAFKGVLLVLGFVAYFSFQSCSSGGGSAPAPPPKQAAPVARLAQGARGALAGQEYTIAGHALVEVAAIAGKFDRHEYILVDAGGRPALLINGLNGSAQEWCLLRPLMPPPLTPLGAAALRRGNLVTIAGVPTTVAGVFQSRALAIDGRPAAKLWPVTIQYGLVARAAEQWAIARWTEAGIQFHAGRSLPEKDVLVALGAAGAAVK